MGHFAKVLNQDISILINGVNTHISGGIVQKVIVAEPEFFTNFVDSSPGQWIQTSYNTQGNKHLLGGTPLRGNYAGIGYIYDSVNDVFYKPQTFSSWILNKSTWLWEAPIPMPTDQFYYWDESSISWKSTK